MNNNYPLNSLELFKERVKIICNKNNIYTVSENKNNNQVDRYILSKKVGKKVVHSIIIYLNEVKKEISDEAFYNIKEYLDNKLPKK